MPLQIIRDDITKVRCDAVVNAAKNSLLGGGGVDGAIHRAAGPGLLAECRTLGGCETGRAKITGAYDLPAKYVIHTVGPVWKGGGSGERELLASCYRESLALAKANGCGSVAFPLISAGVFGYPKDQALRVATETITDFLLENDMTVYIVVFNRGAYLISRKLYADIRSFIDDAYAEAHHLPRPGNRREELEQSLSAGMPADMFLESEVVDSVAIHMPSPGKESGKPAPAAPGTGDPLAELKTALGEKDESFTQMLLRKIDESGMTDAQCYKKANVDRKLFSKIRKDVQYKPSKPTALAFAIALELSLGETEELLRKAGFALSPASDFDVIIRYFILRGKYDVFEINEALFAFDQSLLGA